MLRFPVEIPLQPSRRIFWGFTAAHLVVALPLFLSAGWAMGVRLCLLLGLCGSYLWAVRTQRQPRDTGLLLLGEGTLQLQTAQGWQPASLIHYVHHGWALWLTIRVAGRQHGLMLCADSVPTPEAWRTLSIWCRHKAILVQPAP